MHLTSIETLRDLRAGPRLAIVLALAATACAAMWFVPPIIQDPAYHRFADRRQWLGVPNTLDVISNAPFVVIGLAGLPLAFRGPRDERAGRLLLLIGVALTGFGSAYYHLAPTNERLVWDRLPMTIAFMSLLALTIGERISRRAGRRLLPWLVLVGIGSVLSWQRGGETGDLRLYVLVQFLPMLLIPTMLVLFSGPPGRGGHLYLALGCYLVAKLFEHFDAAILALGRIVSGHTLKHLTAALAVLVIVRMFAPRDPVA